MHWALFRALSCAPGVSLARQPPSLGHLGGRPILLCHFGCRRTIGIRSERRLCDEVHLNLCLPLILSPHATRAAGSCRQGCEGLPDAWGGKVEERPELERNQGWTRMDEVHWNRLRFVGLQESYQPIFTQGCGGLVGHHANHAQSLRGSLDQCLGRVDRQARVDPNRMLVAARAE